MQLDKTGSVVNRHSRLIGDCLTHIVGVYHIPEHRRRVAVPQFDRRTGETYKGGVG